MASTHSYLLANDDTVAHQWTVGGQTELVLSSGGKWANPVTIWQD